MNTLDFKYVYGVTDVNVSKPDGDKGTVKSKEEFVSIAYSDITGASISRNELATLLLPYQSFGDYKLLEDMIIKSFLNLPGATMPTKSQMLADLPKFINDSYRRFYNRDPNEYEQWYLDKFIRDNDMSPDLVYYALMTSNEYRYY
jgi:hypothetical protein